MLLKLSILHLSFALLLLLTRSLDQLLKSNRHPSQQLQGPQLHLSAQVSLKPQKPLLTDDSLPPSYTGCKSKYDSQSHHTRRPFFELHGQHCWYGKSICRALSNTDSSIFSYSFAPCSLRKGIK